LNLAPDIISDVDLLSLLIMVSLYSLCVRPADDCLHNFRVQSVEHRPKEVPWRNIIIIIVREIDLEILKSSNDGGVNLLD